MTKLTGLLAVCCGLVFASSVQAQSNNAQLKGDYAFTFSGTSTGGGGASIPFAAVGRFTADGAGNLSNGELDTNGGLQDKLIAQPFTGTYAIGADSRGLMNLNIPGGGTLAFAMMADGNAKFVEVDASGGRGTVGSGSMEKVDLSAYATNKITGDYAFGAAGLDQSNNRTAIAGRLTANGSGMFTSGAADVNQSGTFTTLSLFAATYMVTDTATGRGVINFPPVLGGAPQNLDFVFYVVNAGKLFAMETDAVSPFTPLLNGVFLQQQTPTLGFSNSSLNGGMVVYLTGRAASGCGVGPAPNVIAGLLTADSNGFLTLTYDQNCGRTANSITGQLGTYNVAANGRAAIRLGTSYVVTYLASSNQGFFIVPDSTVLFGVGEAQAAVPFSNSAVQGKYAGSTTAPSTLGVATFSGEFTADGATPTANITGTEDTGAPSGPTLGTAVSSTYSISSTPANGRGLITGSLGGSGVIYVASASKFVVLSLSDPNPAVLLFEQ